MALNKITLQGRMTKDPELRQTQSGTPVASFTLAWSEKFNDSEQKLFLPCVAWKGNAEFASRYFSKGSEVIAEGKLTSRKWQDRDGNNRETIELIVDRLHFCGPKRETGGEYGSPDMGYSEPDTGCSEPEGFKEIEEDGDLPF